jgi:hypothetical protein
MADTTPSNWVEPENAIESSQEQQDISIAFPRNLDHREVARLPRKGKPLLNVQQRLQKLHRIGYRHQDRV